MHTATARIPDDADVSDEEWTVLVPYLTLMREAAPHRTSPWRELFNGLRFIARTGRQWRLMPHDLPRWPAVYQQTRRWIAAGVVEIIVADLRLLIRLGAGRAPHPGAVIFDSRPPAKHPGRGTRAGWDGATRKKGSKIHLAVDTLGQRLALHVTPANDQDRAPVAALAKAVQAATGDLVERA